MLLSTPHHATALPVKGKDPKPKGFALMARVLNFSLVATFLSSLWALISSQFGLVGCLVGLVFLPFWLSGPSFSRGASGKESKRQNHTHSAHRGFCSDVCLWRRCTFTLHLRQNRQKAEAAPAEGLRHTHSAHRGFCSDVCLWRRCTFTLHLRQNRQKAEAAPAEGVRHTHSAHRGFCSDVAFGSRLLVLDMATLSFVGPRQEMIWAPAKASQQDFRH